MMLATVRANVNAVRGAVERPGGPIVRDMLALVPAFRVRVEAVLRAMRDEGHDPMVFETLRTAERCEELFRRGTGSLHSMHRHGIAADIISESLRWKAPRAFWLSLRKHAEANGLTSGAAWRRVDLPHIQAVPVALQAKVRTLAPAGIDAMVAERLA